MAKFLLSSIVLLSAVFCLGAASSISQVDGPRINSVGGNQPLAEDNPDPRTAIPVVSMVGVPVALLRARARANAANNQQQPGLSAETAAQADINEDGQQQQQEQQQADEPTRVKRQFDWSDCWTCGKGGSSRIIVSGPGVKAGPCGPLVDPLPGSGGGKFGKGR